MKKTEEEIGLAATSNCNPYELMVIRQLEGDYIRNDEVCNLIWDAWRHGAKWMQEQDNWISVEDRLPEKHEGSDEASLNVFCYSEKGDKYFVMRYDYYFENWSYEKSDYQILYPVTHWQPLPEPPKH